MPRSERDTFSLFAVGDGFPPDVAGRRDAAHADDARRDRREGDLAGLHVGAEMAAVARRLIGHGAGEGHGFGKPPQAGPIERFNGLSVRLRTRE
jgi:hypothetical protein